MADEERVEFQVNGMSCHGCEQAIEMLLRQHSGVKDAGADAASGRVWVTLGGAVERAELIERIRAAGFEVA